MKGDNSMIKIVATILFFLGYILISFESFIRISKTAISLVLGILLWIVIMVFMNKQPTMFLHETGGDIFQLVIYLLTAMTLVEIITHYGFFDYVYAKIISWKMSGKALFFLITTLSFFFSAFIDNLTTSIVFLAIARNFFTKKSLIRVGSAIVIAANAGGVFSPIGDVTTTMLWFAGKFSAVTIVTQAFLPSFIAFLTSSLLIGRSISQESMTKVNDLRKITRREWVIIMLSFLSFSLPLVLTILKLPAYMGLLLGIGIVWLVTDITKPHKQSSIIDISIEHFFQKTDMASLQFFVGILLAVSALQYLGILADISHMLFPVSPSDRQMIFGTLVLGGLSAVFDNIPLTAAAIDIVKTTNQSLWVLVAYVVGFGGSLFLIGSAPGVIAMTVIKELTFFRYLKIATLPVLIAFFFGALVWYIQFLFLEGTFAFL